jgi:uncharacterized membrane protein YbhN (UPF0104 family)
MRYNLSFETCTRAVIFDRLVGALGIIVVGVLTFGLQPLFFQGVPSLERFELIVVIGAAVFIIVLFGMTRLQITAAWKPLQMATSWISILGTHFGNPDFVVRQSALAVLNVASVCTAFLLLSRGLGFDVSPLLLIAFTPVILFVNNLPFLYAGWGGRELITVVTLSHVGGVPTDQALLLSICYGLVMLVVALPGAIFWMARPTFRKEVEQASHLDSPSTSNSSIG